MPTTAMDFELINTIPLLTTFLGSLENLRNKPPSLYVDLEGNNLSRSGTLSLITILVEPRHKVYLIDVTTLERNAFDRAGSNRLTLRGLLGSSEIIKVFFDIRNDSDALYSHYWIRVNGIWDLQLMELSSRAFDRKYVSGLEKCIEQDPHITYSEKVKWKRVKANGRALFDPKRGGSYAVFDQRPLSPEVMNYCIQDVAFMPHLCEVYRDKLCDAWWRKVEAETSARILLSQSATYSSVGRQKTEGPREWLHWRPTLAELRSRTLFRRPQRRSQPEPSRSISVPDAGSHRKIEDSSKRMFEDPIDALDRYEEERLESDHEGDLLEQLDFAADNALEAELLDPFGGDLYDEEDSEAERLEQLAEDLYDEEMGFGQHDV